MKLRRVIIAGLILDIAVTAAMAKIVTVGPDPCPLPAEAPPYVAEESLNAQDATPRLKVEKSVVVIHDVRLDNPIARRLFAGLAIDPETGEIIGAEEEPVECKLLH